jgi:hypothetical protein
MEDHQKQIKLIWVNDVDERVFSMFGQVILSMPVRDVTVFY